MDSVDTFHEMRKAKFLSAGVFKIDPVLASEMLEHAAPNRPIMASRVEFYARLMRDHRWKLNGETIIFASDGQCIEGQHRLWAVVESGAEIETFVAFGVDPDVFDSINTGAKRTAGQALGMAGTLNANATASAAALIWRYERGTHSRGGPPYPSTAEIRDVITAHPNLADSVLRGLSLRKVLPISIASAMHYLFAERDPVLAALFFEALEHGVDLRIDDPIRLLRERLIQDRASKSRLPGIEIMALVIKAWNYTREGATVKFLRWRNQGPKPEEFPVIL